MPGVSEPQTQAGPVSTLPWRGVAWIYGVGLPASWFGLGVLGWADYRDETLIAAGLVLVAVLIGGLPGWLFGATAHSAMARAQLMLGQLVVRMMAVLVLALVWVLSIPAETLAGTNAPRRAAGLAMLAWYLVLWLLELKTIARRAPGSGSVPSGASSSPTRAHTPAPDAKLSGSRDDRLDAPSSAQDEPVP